MKNRFSRLILTLACASFIFLSTACSGNSSAGNGVKKSPKKGETAVTVPHGVVYFGAYWKLMEGGSLSYFADVIPGTQVEVVKNGDAPETRKSFDSEKQLEFIHVKLDDESVWVESDSIILDADSNYVLETGTDVFLYESPDVEAPHETRLPTDTLLAFLGPCENTREFADAQKFGRVKIPSSEKGKYTDGYVRLTSIDGSPAHLAMIQVAKKYAQLVNGGNASVEILNELEDTVEELRLWRGR